MATAQSFEAKICKFNLIIDLAIFITFKNEHALLQKYCQYQYMYHSDIFKSYKYEAKNYKITINI